MDVHLIIHCCIAEHETSFMVYFFVNYQILKEALDYAKNHLHFAYMFKVSLTIYKNVKELSFL